MANGTPGNISIGAGNIYAAPLGSTEPTDLVSAWNAAWVQLGYTDKGSKFEYSLKTGNIEVAEELDVVKIASTGRELKVTFDLVEITANNLKRVLNGGTITTNTGNVYYDPPVLGAETRLMLGFQSLDGLERWIWRQTMQVSNVTVNREKAPAKTMYPATFQCELPTSGLLPFRAIFDSTRVGL
jgi:hypothetical protein